MHLDGLFFSWNTEDFLAWGLQPLDGHPFLLFYGIESMLSCPFMPAIGLFWICSAVQTLLIYSLFGWWIENHCRVSGVKEEKHLCLFLLQNQRTPAQQGTSAQQTPYRTITWLILVSRFLLVWNFLIWSVAISTMLYWHDLLIMKCYIPPCIHYLSLCLWEHLCSYLEWDVLNGCYHRA